MATSVAVIGLGPLGLMSMKNLKEDGFKVTGFEKRGYVGGLWKPSQDSSLSVTARTVFNSSRFRSALTDYPFPKGTDDFPTAIQIQQYMEDYCDHFGLRPHVRLNVAISTFRRVDGKWEVEFEQDGSRRTERFDKLLVASGTFGEPKVPKIEGLAKFKGSVLHSIDFPHPAQFKCQNVLLIGLHATAQDITVELSDQAKQVYIAHRSGTILISRFGSDGKSFDQAQTLSFFFVQIFMGTWFPKLWLWFLNKIFPMMSKKSFPYQPKEWNLSPAPSLAMSPPMVADEIYPFLKSGFAIPVAAVRQVDGPKSIQMTDGRVLENIDSIIYCTGYNPAFPFVPDEYNPYDAPGESPNLYRNIFPLHADEDIRNSLAFIGQGAVPYPGFTQFDVTAMAISQIWKGRSHLPALSTMQRWHRDHLAWRKEIIKSSSSSHGTKSEPDDRTFYPVFVDFPDHMRWLDSTAGTGLFEHFSFFSLRAWRFWWSDRDFYKLCKSGLFSSALWRLFDMGKRKAWAGAKKQIIEDNADAEASRAERLRALKKEEATT